MSGSPIRGWPARAAAGAAFVIVAGVAWYSRVSMAELLALPVAFAALVDGWRGGAIVAVLSSFIVLAKPGDAGVMQRTMDSLVLAVLGLLVGMIVDRERRGRRRLEKYKQIPLLHHIFQEYSYTIISSGHSPVQTDSSSPLGNPNGSIL